MSCMNKLSPKAPEAMVDLTFDYTPGLEVGEQLTTFVSRTVAVIAGVDVQGYMSGALINQLIHP